MIADGVCRMTGAEHRDSSVEGSAPESSRPGTAVGADDRSGTLLPDRPETLPTMRLT